VPTRVLTLTASEVDRLVELVDELRRTGYVHAAGIDARIGKLAELAARGGVSVLQIVRRRAPEPGLVLAPGVYASAEGRLVYARPNDPSDLEIARFGWGKPVEVRTDSMRADERGVREGARVGPEGHSFFSESWEDRDGQPLPPLGADAVRSSVGPWYPEWFATNVPELLRLGHVAVQGRAIKALANDEELRKALDSARRLGGADAALAVLDSAGSKES
jgi:hypothetical protein